MQKNEQITVIVPDQKGIEALAAIPGIKVVMVQPDLPVPAEAQEAKVLVVGPSERQYEVDNVLRQISQLPQLKLLQTLGQGVEQWDSLLPPTLTIATARGAHGGSTAEWVLAVLLSLTRDLPEYMRDQRNRLWAGHRTCTLANASVLVYGAGDLGRNVESRLLPFGARVQLVGTHSRDEVIDLAAAQLLLPEADAVIMALPLTPSTQSLVDKDFLALLRDGAIFINAGRGGLLDQASLLEELRNNRLRAALDVMSPEPLPSDSELWDAPGLILTPHIGGNTTGADTRAWQIATEQIRAYIYDH
jgi:phosphoglycerate dehydrogenase-like enzyme